MVKTTNCPNCNELLKTGWASNQLVSETKTNFINYLLKKEAESYCDKCSSTLLKDAKHVFDREKDLHVQTLNKKINAIPILSTHTPYGWDYTSLSIVTGQTVTGTGVISEFKSDISDFFGGQSSSFNKKLADGEQMCFSQLRAKTLQLGGNAIIATDIDYGEAGAGKGMLMVCAAGTAIKVNNTEIFGNKAEEIKELIKAQKRLEELNNFASEHGGLL